MAPGLWTGQGVAGRGQAASSWAASVLALKPLGPGACRPPCGAEALGMGSKYKDPLASWRQVRVQLWSSRAGLGVCGPGQKAQEFHSFLGLILGQVWMPWIQTWESTPPLLCLLHGGWILLPLEPWGWESIPRQGYKKSGVPQEERRVWNSQGGGKGKHGYYHM